MSIARIAEIENQLSLNSDFQFGLFGTSDGLATEKGAIPLTVEGRGAHNSYVIHSR